MGMKLKLKVYLLFGYTSKGCPLRKGEHMKREPIDVYELKSKYWEVKKLG